MPSTSSGTYTVWTTWATDTTNNTTDGTWVYWNASASTSSSTVAYQYQPETAEARQAREQRERERAAERAAAKQRAEALLLGLLTNEQRQEFQQRNSFTVHSELQKRYRIRRGRSQNVDELDDGGRVIARLCAHPHESVPDEDTMAAQLLMLTTNEREFLRVANRSVVPV